MKKNAFTLIELIAVLVIMAVVALVVAPLILDTIRKAKYSVNMRSIDGYGRAVELAMASYQLQYLTYPDSFDELEIEYNGNKVECDTSRINSDHTIYLSGCKVNGKYVKSDKNKDGYYHYGTLKLTDTEYVDTYGKNLEVALKDYYDEHGQYPNNYTTLVLEELDKDVSCDVIVQYDGTVYLENCKVNNETVMDGDNTYVYGSMYATTELLKKTNSIETASYNVGNTHEMYTFEHDETIQTPELTDYRYIGNNPYNYVRFNGNEIWRIIGMFDVENEEGKYQKSIKIMKNEKLENDMVWDNNGVKIWEASEISDYLNINYYTSLGNNEQDMIMDTRYYLGGFNTYGAYDLTNDVLYSYERSDDTYGKNNYFWSGKIGLMYASDYSHTFALGVDNTCGSNLKNCSASGKVKSWIYNLNNDLNQYIMTPERGHGYRYYLSSNGRINVSYSPTNIMSVFPAFYLKSNAKIKSGDGTIDNPYEFEL